MSVVCDRLSVVFLYQNEKLRCIASCIKLGLFMQQLSILLYLADIDKPLHDYMLWKANVYSHSDRLLQILVSAIRYMSKHRYPHILLVVQYPRFYASLNTTQMWNRCHWFIMLMTSPGHLQQHQQEWSGKLPRSSWQKEGWHFKCSLLIKVDTTNW